MNIMPENSKNIAIVGAGLVGAGWAMVFARAGQQVKVYDASETIRRGLPEHLGTSLEALHRHGLVTETPAAITARIQIVETLPQAV
ncbi:MAG: 3-hydroxyacyl-CoA dehydrogenase, partial [Acidocella sp. 20-61-6]